ncbi:MAG TPA: aldo/keto reductase [Gemmataceae bacterium]|nr:aldo/keto reductase [Gemmataceae bacterium]
MSEPTDRPDFLHSSLLQTQSSMPVCRLGLATRGETELRAEDILYAIEQGVNFLNWCGVPDGLRDAIADLGPRKREVVVCVQFEARTAKAARDELRQTLDALRSDYVDILTFYYVEEPAEWREIIAPGGALEYCRQAQRDGQVRLLGLTSHQRPLAAEAARSGLLDLLMIRYNASHRSAEQEVFPVTDRHGVPVVVYTCLRWGALLRSTAEDPPEFIVPSAPAWYRFALQHPSVTVALMAPDNRAELEEDLTVLQTPEPLPAAEYDRLAAHGQRVRKYAGQFP